MSKEMVINGETFHASEEQTLLENLEQQGIQTEYQCRDGHCGACQCQLISGSVEYIIEPLAYVRKNHILTCCSKAKTAIELVIPEAKLPLKLTG
ncbi:class I ribonucleotide reductase maintenance protein YfaE [Motilimonas sp. 1_MG-2023]|uniref:class I ribonucleotide reductase maintenance protein YfaE n=1 Tax=Motilimonas sp. 1_MG-2023 TaxID=3062672 RepID=UPI0026E371B5|nr:class I ribonucleotide reductase maintenance protein YfaE [Motilimonas sp. 1_MG-2023]MDO6524690.1 class I ribonucleotide reductase maintenance protein YfaE [Motilimonas sp. 1_MG-2023]